MSAEWVALIVWLAPAVLLALGTSMWEAADSAVRGQDPGGIPELGVAFVLSLAWPLALPFALAWLLNRGAQSLGRHLVRKRIQAAQLQQDIETLEWELEKEADQ